MADPATMMAMGAGSIGGSSGIGSAELAGGSGGGMGLGEIMGMFGGKLKGKANQIDTGLAQLADLSKRAGIQSLVETEGLFRAFGKQGGGINEAMRGSVGFDPIGAQAQSEAASTLDKRNEARDERINALLDKIGA